jgi:hypothetical protein
MADDTDLSWEATLDLAATDRDALAEMLRTTPAAGNHAKTYPRRWQVMRQQSNTGDRPMPSRWWHRFGPLAEWHAHWLSNRELARGVFYTAYRPPERRAEVSVAAPETPGDETP